MSDELKANRANLTDVYTTHQRELIRQQRKYKKIISTKYLSRKESIGQASYLKSIERLKAEKADVKKQLWVANGITHTRQNEARLKAIKCHVACQEQLTAENTKLRLQTQVMELQLKRVNKTIYELNRKTIPDNQHQAHVIKVRRIKNILENQLEVGIKRECNFTASNQNLREEIVRMINFRSFFNNHYTKMIQRLKSDNKYLTDLIEYAQITFENGTNVYEKITAINKKEAHDREIRKVEMQGITRKTAQDNENFEFLARKDRKRELADLEPREHKRRMIFRKAYAKKIKLYNTVLAKILAHSNTQTIDKVIDNFQEQESRYYSYFSYVNEKNYHITNLNIMVHDLYKHIEDLRVKNKTTVDTQLEKIAHLKRVLAEKVTANKQLNMKKKKLDNTLAGFLKGFYLIFEVIRADPTPLKNMLGDYSAISTLNIKIFLHVLEDRLNEIVARVFCGQRNDPKIKHANYVVKNISKVSEPTTELDDIVLTQQCPECAEGEAINTDVTDCAIEPFEDIRKKVHEKVVQPEMQYRLHSISECRLQHSRMLASSKLN